jgi:4-oxalomesaconate tautomerase
MAEGVRCMLMRGGTSKGAYFVADDVPDSRRERDDLLLRIMGSPDLRQIDGVGGAHPLTSKVAVVAASADDHADVDYLFLQVSVDEALVSDSQNCGNILAGVAPFAIERGLIPAPTGDTTSVRVRMLNTGSLVTAMVPVADGRPIYAGDTAISGVPGRGARIRLDFDDVAGDSCGALLPTGHVSEEVAGVTATLIDCGMPVVVMAAEDTGITGHEPCAELEANTELRTLLETVRLAAGPLMNLGDVSDKPVPKLTLVASPVDGGTLCTRTFIPHRCHDAIGVLGAISVAASARLPGTTAAGLAIFGSDPSTVVLEHPSGIFETNIELAVVDGVPGVERAGIIRTARKLMDGVVFPRPA